MTGGQKRGRGGWDKASSGGNSSASGNTNKSKEGDGRGRGMGRGHGNGNANRGNKLNGFTLDDLNNDWYGPPKSNANANTNANAWNGAFAVNGFEQDANASMDIGTTPLPTHKPNTNINNSTDAQNTNTNQQRMEDPNPGENPNNALLKKDVSLLTPAERMYRRLLEQREKKNLIPLGYTEAPTPWLNTTSESAKKSYFVQNSAGAIRASRDAAEMQEAVMIASNLAANQHVVTTGGEPSAYAPSSHYGDGLGAASMFSVNQGNSKPSNSNDRCMSKVRRTNEDRGDVSMSTSKGNPFDIAVGHGNVELRRQNSGGFGAHSSHAAHPRHRGAAGDSNTKKNKPVPDKVMRYLNQLQNVNQSDTHRTTTQHTLDAIVGPSASQRNGLGPGGETSFVSEAVVCNPGEGFDTDTLRGALPGAASIAATDIPLSVIVLDAPVTYQAEQFAIAAYTSEGTRTQTWTETESIYHAFMDVKGTLNVSWNSSIKDPGLIISYDQADYHFVWKISADAFRSGSCMERKAAGSKTYSVIIGLNRVPVIIVEGMGNKGVRPTSPFSERLVNINVDHTSSWTARDCGYSFVQERYALNERTGGLEELGYKFMDAIYLVFPATQASQVEQSPFLEYLRACGFMRTKEGRCHSFEIDRVVPERNDFVVDNRWETLPFSVGWKINVLLSHCWLAPTALSSQFLRKLNDVGKDYAVRALEYLEEHIFHVGGKLSAQEAFAALTVITTRLSQNPTLFVSPVIAETPSAMQPACFWIGHVEVTPTKYYCRGPFAEVSNRMLRTFVEHAQDFIRVTFVSEDSQPIRSNDKLLVDRMFGVMNRGLDIFGRTYNFLHYSQSQLRSSSCWFLAKDSKLNPSEVLEWMGDVSEIRCPGKLAARLGLCLSATRPTLPLAPHEFTVEDDILSDPIIEGGPYEMTDGCGEISYEFADQLRDVLQESSVPSAFQIRFGGFKGMLVVSKNLPAAQKVLFRKSMKKLEAPQLSIEVCETSRFRPVFTNRQIILVQNALGVKKEIFLRKQRAYLDQLLALVNEDDKMAGVHLLYSGGTGTDREWEMHLATLISNGFDRNDIFLQSTLHDIARWNMVQVKKKSRIRLDEGALLFGVCDPSHTLEYGQVVVQVNIPNKVTGQSELKTIEGRVMVTKNPCMHPGDIRVLTAIKPPAGIAHLHDVVVFPTRGKRPHSSEMALGDLDGDFYSVYWDKEMVPTTTVTPIIYTPPEPEIVEDEITMEHIRRFFVFYVLGNNVGQISNAHAVWADKDSVLSENCEHLAKYFNDAINFAKTGKTARFPEELRVDEFPHYMEKRDKKSYHSESVLGGMYDSVLSIYANFDLKLNANRDYAKTSVDPSLIMPGIADREKAEWFEKVKQIKSQYDQELVSLLNQFRVTSESQLFCGAFQTNVQTMTREKMNSDRAMISMNRLKSKYRDRFKQDITAMDEQQINFQSMRNASFWYEVAYTLVEPPEGAIAPRYPLRSFAWLHPEHLIRVKHLNSKIGREARPVEEEFASAAKEEPMLILG